MRWVARDNLHVTIRFLGSVDAARIEAVSSAIATAVSGLVDVPVRLDALGAFPDARRARVVWAGIADPAGGIGAVAQLVGDALDAIGFAPEARAFVPHVTLARLKQPREIDLAHPLPAERFVVDRVTLFESHLSREGARYESLAVFPFKRAPAVPR